MTNGHGSRNKMTRRSLLSAMGATTLAGCLDRVNLPTNIGQPQRNAIPVGEPPGPLHFSLDVFKEAAVNSPVDTDEIPAIDEPEFVEPSAGDEYLEPDDVVFGVHINGKARAYPQPILAWHEIVNDTIDSLNIAVTYCPLTGTAIGYKRGETRFGIEGWLMNSNLIMFDRETKSWWPQVLGTAVSGSYKGAGLEQIPVVWTRWNRWKDAHPDTTVLSTDTGYIRNYQDDPYGWYSEEDSDSPQEVVPSQSEWEMLNYYRSSVLYYPVITEDFQFTAKVVVVGARTPDAATVVPKNRLLDAGVITGELSGDEIIGVYDEELDTGYFYRNPEGLPIEKTTNNALKIDGTVHPLSAVPLPRIDAFEAMWFAWNAFYPDSTIIE